MEKLSCISYTFYIFEKNVFMIMSTRVGNNGKNKNQDNREMRNDVNHHPPKTTMRWGTLHAIIFVAATLEG